MLVFPVNADFVRVDLTVDGYLAYMFKDPVTTMNLLPPTNSSMEYDGEVRSLVI